MQNKGNTELIPRKVANCGKDCARHRCDGHEFKPHLKGHWDKAHDSGEVLPGARSLTSNGMLPHCIHLEGLSTLGLKQRRLRRCLRHHAGNSVAPHACGVVEA